MSNKRPKTKLEEFVEELKNAKTKEELLKVINRMETYVKLHPSEEGYYLLSLAKYNLGDLSEALKWIQYARSLKARLFEIAIYHTAAEFKKAYNLIRELKKLKVDENMGEQLKVKEVITLWLMWEYEKVVRLWDKKVKEALLGSDVELGDKIIKKVEGYLKAQQTLSKDKKLKKAIGTLESIVEKKIPNSKVVPIVEQDLEYPIEELWVYIVIPEDTEYQLIEKLEDGIIDEVIFKQETDLNYAFIKSKETEPLVYS